MIQSSCQCGAALFFDSGSCSQCSAVVGFDLVTGVQSLVQIDEKMWQAPSGKRFKLCANTIDHDVCNWLVSAESRQSYCPACQFNRTIPNLSKPENKHLWWRLEHAKKRMLFGLYQTGLWPQVGWNCNDGLLFDFIEDGRSNWDFAETFVTTGFSGGIITLNVLEANDVARKQAQEEMQERYRTLLGHFRHEIGHYFWGQFAQDEAWLKQVRQRFGDERVDYGEALKEYYLTGGASDWSDHFISRYASAHPVEDWAETWAHYLHMMDALDTAHQQGFIRSDPFVADFDTKLRQWQRLSVALNELNRAVGHNDAYPFVIGEPIAQKLEFVDLTILQWRERTSI